MCLVVLLYFIVQALPTNAIGVLSELPEVLLPSTACQIMKPPSLSAFSRKDVCAAPTPPVLLPFPAEMISPLAAVLPADGSFALRRWWGTLRKKVALVFIAWPPHFLQTRCAEFLPSFRPIKMLSCTITSLALFSGDVC